MQRLILYATMVTVALAALFSCATTPGDPEGPQITLTREGPFYISPAASPGEKDALFMEIEAGAPGDAVLTEYTMKVINDRGETVYTISESSPDEDTPVHIPSRIAWSGRNNSGNFVDEGRYVVAVGIVDSQGRSAESQPMEVIVDNTPPDAEVATPYNVFAPGSEGERDALIIVNQFEDVAAWDGEILDDDGNVVRSWAWPDTPPLQLRWEGRDNDGDYADDGRYTYRLRGVDRAGNSVIARQQGIRVETDIEKVGISANRRAFSPNDDGFRDTVTFEIRIPGDLELLEWSIEVVSQEDEEAVLSRSGEANLPEEVEFDGLEEGEPFPEGAYPGRAEVTYRNGESDEATTEPVELDLTAPEASVSLVSDGFNPDGDDGPTTMIVEQETEGAISWEGRILPADEDDIVTSVEWEDEAPEEFSWNGQTEGGEEAATGRYRYQLRGRDRAGNRVTRESEEFLLDRNAPSIDLSFGPTPFAPGDEAGDEELEIGMDISDRADIEEWRVVIYDHRGDEFHRITGQGSPSDTVSWDGRDDDGELPASGREYSLAVTVTDEVGNESTVERDLPIGILVERDQDGDLRFRVGDIHFAPFEADYQDLDDEELIEENQETLDEVADLLGEYPDREVRIEGHAAHIYEEEERRKLEQEQTLLPLSTARAEAIRDALVERGVDANRLSTAGRGGTEPLVSHQDLDRRWRNRRVEFELLSN